MAPATHQIELALAEKQSLASDWFRALRDDICAAFEAIEDMAAPAQNPLVDLYEKAGNGRAAVAAK